MTGEHISLSLQRNIHSFGSLRNFSNFLTIHSCGSCNKLTQLLKKNHWPVIKILKGDINRPENNDKQGGDDRQRVRHPTLLTTVSRKHLNFIGTISNKLFLAL